MKRVDGLSGESLARKYKMRRIRQVSAMLFVYAIFYICRLAFSASKKDMIEQGAYTAKEIGIVGSAMLIAYAIGKFVNGFVADRVNVRRYIMFGLFVSAMANFVVGFHVPALMLAVVWFVNGLAQSTGAPCCVVALSRWWPKERRGTYYGIWSCSNNLGEVFAYILTAGVMSAIFCPPDVSTFASTASTGTGGRPSSSGALPKKSHAAAMPIAPIADAPQKQLRQA